MAEDKQTQTEEKEQASSQVEPNEEENMEAVFDEELLTKEQEASGDQNSIETQLKEANEKIEQLEKKIEDADNRYLRLQADFDNSRRRAKLDFEASQKYRAQNLISDLLPAIDNFERALSMNADNEQAKSLLQGMEMVYRSLVETLQKEGVEPIEAVGKEFDPNIHQAVMTVEDSNFASNMVVEEFQKGYLLKDRVIRPSMVKVSQ
ncbi:nucleotide exchange factor GrpE [Cytobacillus sp. Hz8]|uniref:nucleotide exchange factor GrpE n=1 Tax=Cytobacillus sp. Hz8 TaxID=3347168 RepID=UPI0035E35EC4